MYDSNKKAKYPEHNVNPSWNNCSFPTFVEALQYAWHWLGAYSYGVKLVVNVPEDYSGCGDMIEIREE